ncbi:MAG: DpnI domain-containing protein [Brevundimonas sp.]|uniref:DpnI domain-containing protein n=1 Tax=Brevundimonas sp. TaxID=1871086 RepID=UPI0028D1C53A|nr:DpnI domain-containing protein [uncultured Brevundimonas sp.]
MGQDDNRWSQLGFAEEQAVFKGATQNVRALSEHWVAANMFCPACGAERLRTLPNNSPVGDFVCDTCAEEFELKAKKGALGKSIPDGSFRAMTARLAARNNPSLFAMSYDRDRTAVTDLIVVPRHFFTQDVIQARKPLSSTARRAGWQGCNILIGQVPLSGRIPLITQGIHVSKSDVLNRWRSTLFVKETSLKARGWLLAVMKVVEAIGKPEFTLAEVYAREAALAALYPGNSNVRPKIRQQLQVLRDQGWLAFNGRGTYRRV